MHEDTEGGGDVWDVWGERSANQIVWVVAWEALKAC